MASFRLLTRADDAGLNRSTNRAIRASVKQGIVRNVSVLATAPDLEDAAELLLDLDGLVDFGLHVCLTSEWKQPRYTPVSGNAKSMIRSDGSFPAGVEELATLEPDVDEVADEVRAQLERLRSLGFDVKYIDEHMLVGSITTVRDGIVEVASNASLVYDRELTETGDIARVPNWNGPGPHPGTELADHLSSMEWGTYLLIGHPGFKADEMQGLKLESGAERDILQERNRERRMFADIEIVDYCDNAGVNLLRYSQV